MKYENLVERLTNNASATAAASSSPIPHYHRCSHRLHSQAYRIKVIHTKKT